MGRLPFIFFTIVLDALGIGLLIPVLPDVIRRFTDDPQQVTLLYGYFLSAYAAMQFFASPVLGSLSDRFGRRPILLVSLLGSAIDYLFMAFAPTFSLLFIGRAISGLTGASMTVAASYIADVSDDSNRAKNFGVIGAAWSAGFIIGPVLGGALLGLGPKSPFIAAALMNLANFLFGAFILPESLKAEHKRQLSAKMFNPLLSLLKVLKNPHIAAFVWVYALIFLSGQVHPVNWTLYTQAKWGWTAVQVGFSLAAVGVSNGFVQALLPRYVIPKFGEMKSFILGMMLCTVGYAAFGLVPEAWMVYPVIIFFALSGIAQPALQSIISRKVDPSEQGELQGSLISIGSLTCIVAPFIFSRIFMRFSIKADPNYFPGAAYIAASLFSLVALGLGLMAVRSHKKAQKQIG